MSASSVVAPLLYTEKEAATALRVSDRTIRNLLRTGALVRRKIGASTRIPISSVEAFIRRDHATGQEGKRKRKKGSAR